MNRSSITVRTTTRQKLKKTGRKDQTYDDLINRLITLKTSKKKNSLEWGVGSSQSSESSCPREEVQVELACNSGIAFYTHNDLEIQVNVRCTYMVIIVIGCSNAHIAVDVYGVIRISEALSTIEDELAAIIKQNVSDSNSNIDISNDTSWIVTRCDFSFDALVRYAGEKFFISWHAWHDVLITFYTKKWTEDNYHLTVKCQEFPNKPLVKALSERLSPKEGS